jgi:hypothetical protein
MNSCGETIKSPVDGFCKVYNSDPAHFVIIEHTTIEKRNLEKKWLYERKKIDQQDGDLIKAINKIDQIKKDFPDAKFTIVLSTNQHLDTDLSGKVYKKSNQFNVQLDIWEQSRIADYLDTTPHGHWLRKMHLNIEAELISEELFRSICESSLLAYRKDLLFAVSAKWISRSISRQVWASICDQRKSIQFLVGESGFGKSTVAFQSLEEHITNGGYGLWLPAGIVQDCLTFQNAIIKVITSLHPAVDINSAYSLFEYFNSTNKLLIVVDDINQESDPLKTANKLISWAAPVAAEKENEILASNIIVCPVWPQLWNGLEIVSKGKEWIDATFVDVFNNLEGKEALFLSNATLISEFEAETMAIKLGNDPFLIALFSTMHQDMPNASMDFLVEDVIEKYVSHCISKVVSIEPSFLQGEYQQALLKLSTFMLQKKKMHPTWTEITEWFVQNEPSIKMIRCLINARFLCRLNSQDQFVFRHDRIQNALLVKAMIQLFIVKNDIDDILAEPYYSELIAQAILRCPDIEILGKITQVNILALVESLRLFGVAKTDFERSIVKEIANWIQEHSPIPDSLFQAICLSLVETDSPSVLDITRDFPSGRLVWLARLRNGCAASGAKYCMSGFGPASSISDKLRDRIIDHSKKRYQDELVRQLKSLLNDTQVSDDVREGVLSFSGFMSSEALAVYILPYWRSAADKQRILPEALWAGMRCTRLHPEKVLDELLACWATLPEKSDEAAFHSPRNEVAEALRLSFCYGIDEKILDYLCEQQQQVGNLKWAITYMLGQVDNPRTLEMIVNTAADIQRKTEATKDFSPWLVMLTDTWNRKILGSRRMSDQSFVSLHKTWTTTTDKYIQKTAFRLWCTRAENKDIDILRNIPSNSAIYRKAIWERAQLGDASVVSAFAILFRDECHWCHVAHHIWSPEIMAVVRQHILSFEANIPKDFSGEELNPHYEVSELITRIPLQDAETLLVDYWYILGYSPKFVQAALYVSTQKTLELAAQSIAMCPVEVNLFKYISFLFGSTNEKRNSLTQAKLNSLIPYMDRLSENDLLHIMEASARLGMPEWGKKHVVNLSENHRRRYNPSENDLIKDLDEMANDQHGIWKVGLWLEDFNNRNDSPERALCVTDLWLGNSKRDYLSYKIAAAVLKSVGSRKHINILYKHQPQNIPATMLSEIIDDTKFAISLRTLG